MAALDPKTLQEVLDFAVESARLAGSFTLGYFNASPPVELKADRTPVTAADRGAEERLRQRIERAFPTHGIVGEELGVKTGTEPARWPETCTRSPLTSWLAFSKRAWTT